jgi:Cu2+-exporting ATPase
MTQADKGIEASAVYCYHCNTATKAPIHAEIFGQNRVFCSETCLAVTRVIVTEGLTEYYDHRAAAPEASRRDVPAANFDHAAISKSFVRSCGAHQTAAFILEGVSCSACMWLIEQTLRKLDGVEEVRMEQTSHQAYVAWDPARLKVSDILTAVDGIGFTAHPFDTTRRDALEKEKRHRTLERLLMAGLLLMPVMGFQIAGYWMGADADGLADFQRIGRWFVLAAVTIVLAYSGADFFAGALRDIRNRHPGMDIPIVLGLSIAWLGSAVATVQGRGDVYFDSIVMFVFFILIARRWELQGRVQAGASIDRMMKVIPQEVTRLGAHGPEKVMLHDVGLGDRLIVAPGEVVPVDGILLDQDSSFDESLLTGEARPVTRQVGDIVVGGSCNIDQPVLIQVSKTLETSTLAEVQAMMQRGLNERPRFAQAAERIVPWFVIAVLAVASFTALLWLWLDPAQVLPNVVAVLIVTCPCALALATPVALAAAAGQMSGSGILVTRMSAIEPLSVADTFVFDKTGTLTQGRPVLQEVYTPLGGNPDAALGLAAAMNARSEHSLGLACVTAANDRGLVVAPLTVPVRNYPGKGVQVVDGGYRYRLGSIAFSGLEPERDTAEWIDTMLAQGHSVIALTEDGELLALFAFMDRLRDGAEGVIATLKKSGYAVAVLSGDKQEVVDHLAQKLHIDVALGGLSPSDKMDWVCALQDKGKRIVMVGDGINDAPVLARADASISFADATTLARQSSDFVLLPQSLASFTQLRLLSIKTTRIIRQNLMWALAYNVLAVPAAAFGFVPPWAAAIGMSVSSLFVVSNAMRLTRKQN